MLSRRRGTDLPAARWERGPFGNSARSVGYTCTIYLSSLEHLRPPHQRRPEGLAVLEGPL
jgi:hypothetical protein